VFYRDGEKKQAIKPTSLFICNNATMSMQYCILIVAVDFYSGNHICFQYAKNCTSKPAHAQ
jgi:hypothetical protein